MRLNASVVINQSHGRDEAIDGFCREHALPVGLVIPYDRAVAAAYAEGVSLVEAQPEWEAPLVDLLRGIEARERVA
jgi:MinD superfamily P-loop ATPase